MAKGTIQNEVLVFRDMEIIGRFGYSDKEGQKMPAKAADAFLNSILKDESSPWHADLLAGKIETIGGHPTKIQPWDSRYYASFTFL